MYCHLCCELSVVDSLGPGQKPLTTEKIDENLFLKPFHSSGPFVSVIKTVFVHAVFKPIVIVRDKKHLKEMNKQDLLKISNVNNAQETDYPLGGTFARS